VFMTKIYLRLFAVQVLVQLIGLLSSAVEGFTFFRLPPREAVQKVSNAPSYAAVVTPHLGESHMNLLNTRVHLDMHPFLLGMSIASLCSPLGSNAAWQRSLKNYFGPSPDQPS